MFGCLNVCASPWQALKKNNEALKQTLTEKDGVKVIKQSKQIKFLATKKC
jgi:hypothetical protein